MSDAHLVGGNPPQGKGHVWAARPVRAVREPSRSQNLRSCSPSAGGKRQRLRNRQRWWRRGLWRRSCPRLPAGADGGLSAPVSPAHPGLVPAARPATPCVRSCRFQKNPELPVGSEIDGQKTGHQQGGAQSDQGDAGIARRLQSRAVGRRSGVRREKHRGRKMRIEQGNSFQDAGIGGNDLLDGRKYPELAVAGRGNDRPTWRRDPCP